MTMREHPAHDGAAGARAPHVGVLRVVLAGALGLAAALLIACGSSGKGLIPVADSGPLQNDFEAVRQAAESGSGNCSATEAALLKTAEDFSALPASVDSGLHSTLRQGIDNLRTRALALCTQPIVKTTTGHDAEDDDGDDARDDPDGDDTDDADDDPDHTDDADVAEQGRRHGGAGRSAQRRTGRHRTRRKPLRRSPRRSRRGRRRRARGRAGRRQMSAAEIGGRYRLQSRLGFGGMSTVHLALDQRLERQVAVKLLAEHLADDPAFVSRFQREAQAAARLVHPNIVQVFDSGRDQRTDQYYIVMEYIEGASCAEILRDDGWVEVPDALSIIGQACEGLHYAHRHGVVHRDVKPGNLLRAREGEVKLADFGIAKATEQSSITQVGSVLGTAAYLAPEQARGEEAGPSADLYALGVVTYQLISGRLPYEATSLTELALRQQQEEPPTLDTLVAAVNPELADAVAIALALDPRERYSDASEMGQALSAGARGIAPSPPPRRLPASARDRRHERALGQPPRRGREGRCRHAPPAPGAAALAAAGRRSPCRPETARQQPPADRRAGAARARSRDRRGAPDSRTRRLLIADQGDAAQRRLLRSQRSLRGAQAARRRKHQVAAAAAVAATNGPALPSRLGGATAPC